MLLLNMKQHVETHFNKKPYQCTIYYKYFKTNAILKQHMKLHTDEKNYRFMIKNCSCN